MLYPYNVTRIISILSEYFLSEMESSKMEDPQTQEEEDIIDKAKEVTKEVRNSEDTNEKGKPIRL